MNGSTAGENILPRVLVPVTWWLTLDLQHMLSQAESLNCDFDLGARFSREKCLLIT